MAVVLLGFLLPKFQKLSTSAAGERATAFKSLRPLREAGKGGQDFQEAFLQRGSEESLGPPHAALPGSLLQCSPGETHLGFVYKVQGLLSPKGTHALGLPARLAGVSPSSLSLPKTPKAMICWFLVPGWERHQSR